MTRLAHLQANGLWVFIFGDAPFSMGDTLFFRTRRDATAAARRCGLTVRRCGRVEVAQ